MPFNSPHKDIIRKQWDMPLLKFLHDDLQSKLIYLGFPGKECKDIYEWKDYLKRIFAFQCRVYGKPSHEDQPREEVEALIAEIDKIESATDIKGSIIFDGWIEEVITRKLDTMGLPFSLDEIVTLYNLDFCQSLHYPREVVLPDGVTRKIVSKLDVIDDLLRIQSELENALGGDHRSKFVLLITVQNSYVKKDYKAFKSDLGVPFKSFLEKYDIKKPGRSSEEAHAQNARIVRSIIVAEVFERFHTHKFIPIVLPSIWYEGDSGTPMLHFTILGIRSDSHELAQRREDLLSEKFIVFRDNKLSLWDDSIIAENDVNFDPAGSFKKTKVFQELWNA